MRVLACFLATLSVVACSPRSDGAEDETQDDAEGGLDATADGGALCLVCSSDATEDLPDWVSVKDEIDRVCSSADNCHGSGAGAMGLSPGREFGSLINVTSTENPPMKRVLPGDPAQSYVYLKLACEGGIVDACMPYGATHDPALAHLFHDWIEGGAPTQ